MQHAFRLNHKLQKGKHPLSLWIAELALLLGPGSLQLTLGNVTVTM